MFNYKLAKGFGTAMVLAAVFTTYAAAQGCQGLDCAAGFTPPAGHGPASETDPRRVINIFIDMGNPTPTRAWSAIQAAATSWNNATDEYGNKTGYYLQVNQAQSSSADITIRMTGDRGTTGNVCPGDDWACVSNGVVNLAGQNLTSPLISVTDLAATVAHEIGHPLGLINTTCASEQSQSIMGGVNATGTIPSGAPSGPTALDVVFANVALNSNGASCQGVDQTSSRSVVSSGGGAVTSEEEEEDYEYEEGYDYYRCTAVWEVTDVYTANGEYMYTSYQLLYVYGCTLISELENEVARVADGPANERLRRWRMPPQWARSASRQVRNRIG